MTNIHFGKVVDEEEAVTKIIQDLDRNSDNAISEEEFVEGFTKWVNSFSTEAPSSKPLPHEETHQVFALFLNSNFLFIS